VADDQSRGAACRDRAREGAVESVSDGDLTACGEATHVEAGYGV